MAIDQTAVALDIAARGVTLAGQLQQTVEQLNDLLTWGLAAGLDLTQYNEQFAASSELKHVDGATLNQLFAVVAPGVKAYLDATELNGVDYMTIIHKARRA